MIHFVRTLRCGPKWREASKWALKTADCINQKRPSVNCEVLANVTGAQDEIHFVSRFESLTDYEKSYEEQFKDPTFLKLMEEAEAEGNNFFIGAPRDHFYRTVT